MNRKNFLSAAPAAASNGGNEITVDLMAGRRLGSEPSHGRPRPKKLRTWDDLDEVEPKKKPEPAINLYNRLAQRREEYKEREGIM